MAYKIYDPFRDLPDDTDINVGEWLGEQGWEEFLSVGAEHSPIRVQSYRRMLDDKTWEYMLDVHDVSGSTEFIKADSAGDLMDMLSRWAPAVQAAAVAGLIDEISNFDLTDYNPVSRAAAHVVYGMETVLPNMRTQQREQHQRYLQVRQVRQVRQARQARQARDGAATAVSPADPEQ